jgi:SHS2 domain-containing protein
VSGYRIVEHPSDVGFELWGATFPELADAAVRALAAVCTGGQLPPAVDERPAPPISPDEAGLVALLESCLVELDAEDWLAVGYRDGHLVGAPLPADARENGTHVKAITWHHLGVEQRAEGWRGSVVVDL